MLDTLGLPLPWALDTSCTLAGDYIAEIQCIALHSQDIDFLTHLALSLLRLPAKHGLNGPCQHTGLRKCVLLQKRWPQSHEPMAFHLSNDFKLTCWITKQIPSQTTTVVSHGAKSKSTFSSNSAKWLSSPHQWPAAQHLELPRTICVLHSQCSLVSIQHVRFSAKNWVFSDTVILRWRQLRTNSVNSWVWSPARIEDVRNGDESLRLQFLETTMLDKWLIETHVNGKLQTGNNLTTRDREREIELNQNQKRQERKRSTISVSKSMPLLSYWNILQDGNECILPIA